MLKTNLKIASILITSILTGFNVSANPLQGAITQGENQSTQIVGGEEAIKGEFPFMVSLNYKGKVDGVMVDRHMCGASIINDKYLLTAAHCLENLTAKNFTAQIGFHDLKDKNSGQRIKVESAIIHPNYDDENSDAFNDVAVLKLSEKIKKDWLKPIHLSTAHQDSILARPEDILTVSGWGALKDDGDDYPNLLQKV